MQNDTIFGKIIRGEIPATKVYEDDKCLAFLDASPANIGHTLVISKDPYRNIFDASEEIVAHLFVIAKKVAIALKEGLGAQGVNVFMNNESAAGQVVFHIHLHVIPRYGNDGIKVNHPPHTYAEGEREAVAGKIKSAL